MNIELRRSGFAEWAYEYAFEHLFTLPLAVVAFLGNVLTHLLVFRGGWTLHIVANERYSKVRYKSKAEALADMDRQRTLAAAIPPPEPVEPVRLPTRGGSLRRPW